jgi:hypothetical protein
LGFLKWVQTSVETIKTFGAILFVSAGGGVLDIKRLKEWELWKLDVVENDDSCVEICDAAASLF